MNFELIIITIATAFIAAASTLITLLITNKQQIKLKDKEMELLVYTEEFRHIQKLFEDYLRSISYVLDQNMSSANVMSSSFALLPYLPKSKKGIFRRYSASIVMYRNSENS